MGIERAMSMEVQEIYVSDEGGAPVGGTSVEEEMVTLLLEDWVVDGKPILAPAEVYTTNQYAPYVEFGTGPAKKKITGGQSLEDHLRKWVVEKLHITDPDKVKKTVNHIALKIRENGINPQPYFRSAMYSVLDEKCDDSETYLSDEKGSILKLCEDIKDRIDENLSNNGTNYSGAMMQSFKAEIIEDYTINNKTGEVTINGVSDNIDEDELWQEKSKDKGINNKRAVYHKGH